VGRTGLRRLDSLTLHTKETHNMASNGKKKTTMAKLNREAKLRERRMDKQTKKDARKRAAADPAPPTAEPVVTDDE
jgi:hypothetical protein